MSDSSTSRVRRREALRIGAATPKAPVDGAAAIVASCRPGGDEEEMPGYWKVLIENVLDGMDERASWYYDTDSNSNYIIVKDVLGCFSIDYPFSINNDHNVDTRSAQAILRTVGTKHIMKMAAIPQSTLTFVIVHEPADSTNSAPINEVNVPGSSENATNARVPTQEDENAFRKQVYDDGADIMDNDTSIAKSAVFYDTLTKDNYSREYSSLLGLLHLHTPFVLRSLLARFRVVQGKVHGPQCSFLNCLQKFADDRTYGNSGQQADDNSEACSDKEFQAGSDNDSVKPPKSLRQVALRSTSRVQLRATFRIHLSLTSRVHLSYWVGL
ncbi:hypothetical protein P171DRAFT_480829 [Karstenula rhodostoma CBS 690.94]|uniref:Uncharacterized protein n=1 Tax=Karstenula rhodostoma CBS 690.94 TaxID=1392251 RepID=A0A9P4PT76_9PLEO|nr:hypothetical protein P171DRAFT_480829 [Karstenula rhodostoma CBS 690.94]